jgi:hypothetical protein
MKDDVIFVLDYIENQEKSEKFLKKMIMKIFLDLLFIQIVDVI